jgi:murein DD-endopeptidase MepM/ murein hydrolase activator NlpD
MVVTFLKSTLLLAAVTMARRRVRDRLSAAVRFRLVFLVMECLPLLAIGPAYDALARSSATTTAQHAFGTAGEDEGIIVLHPTVNRGLSIPRIEVPDRLAHFLVLGWGILTALIAAKSAVLRAVSALALRRLAPCRDARWLQALSAAKKRHGVTRRIVLLDGIASPPFTAGLLGRTIIVPVDVREWSGESRIAILLHEVAHVKRSDVLLMGFIEIIAAAFWCVPFVHAAVKALVEDREEACDALAVERGADPSELASLLLEMAASHRSWPIPGAQGMLGRSLDRPAKIERRIRMIINEKRAAEGTPRIRRAAAAGIVLAIALIGLTGLPPLFAVGPSGGEGGREISVITAEGVSKSIPTDLTDLPCAAPLTGDWRVSQPFGRQTNPVTGKPYLHRGIDLTDGRSGDTVRSTMAGRVIETGTDKGKGRYVVIANGAIEVCFQKLKSVRVATGDFVSVGTEVGTVGTSGVSTGPHLHYEVWVQGTAVDPGALLKTGNAGYAGL